MLTLMRLLTIGFWVGSSLSAYYTQHYILTQVGLVPLGKGGDWEFTIALAMITGTVLLWRISNEISKDISKETARRKLIVERHDQNGR